MPPTLPAPGKQVRVATELVERSQLSRPIHRLAPELEYDQQISLREQVKLEDKRVDQVEYSLRKKQRQTHRRTKKRSTKAQRGVTSSLRSDEYREMGLGNRLTPRGAEWDMER